MERPPTNADAQLAESLRRISGALDRNKDAYAAVVGQIVAATSAEVAERIAAKTDRAAARIVGKHERRMERLRQREERRRHRRSEHEGRDPAGEISRGVVFAVVAIICLMLALREPPLFWMVFVALGFGMSAVSAFSRAARREPTRVETDTEEEAERAPSAAGTATPQAEKAVPPVPPVVTSRPDPRVARIQNLCDKILAELESGPPVVREVVTEPQATIGGLRRACVETARRERELREVLAAQDDAGLLSERETLKTRLAAEGDAIVRDRLGQALAALDQQLAHRAELATAATRLEAENTRILYTLENLHMQLLRARTTDIGGPELGGRLRDSLRELGAQIDAVAEALEFASAPTGAERTTDAASANEGAGGAATATSASDEEQRAERAAAARRAAASREAQRR